MIVPADPAWPQIYERIAVLVRAALGTEAIELDHIGSTAVPGLPAKPVIDIDLTVPDSADEDAYVPALEAAGFQLLLRERGWHEHRLLTLGDPLTNLHVFSPDCPEVVRHRMFRDWLRAHPEDRQRYVQAKIAASAETRLGTENVMEYNLHKQPMIREIYDRMFRGNDLA